MRHLNLFTTNFLKIEYNAVDDILVSQWSGPLANEDVINGYENISFFLKKNVCHKLLDNHLEVQGIWSDISDWVAYDWHPRAEAAGLRYHACVYAKSVFSRLSTDQTIRMIKTGIVKGFEEVSSAESWLKDM